MMPDTQRLRPTKVVVPSELVTTVSGPGDRAQPQADVVVRDLLAMPGQQFGDQIEEQVAGSRGDRGAMQRPGDGKLSRSGLALFGLALRLGDQAEPVAVGSGTRELRPRMARSPHSRSDTGTETGSDFHHDIMGPMRGSGSSGPKSRCRAG